MKKILSMFVILLFASSFFANAQEQAVKSANSNNAFELSEKIAGFPPSDIRADEFELKYTDGPLYWGWGNTSTQGTWYASACISFTQAQMLSFANGTNYLHTITLAHPSAAGMPNLNNEGCKIWIKETLDGPVVHEQSFVPTPGASQSVTLTTPYTLPVGKSLVLGYTLLLENVVLGDAFRPVGMSETGNVPGAFHYIYTQDPNHYGQGANFITPPPSNASGCLVLKGIGEGASAQNNLAALGIKTDDYELQVVGSEHNFTVTVGNPGSVPQSNYKVQIIDENNAIVASKDVTTTIAAGANIDIDFLIQPDLAGEYRYRGKVILEGDEIPEDDVTTVVRIGMFYPMQPIAYCNRKIDVTYYWPDDATVKWYGVKVPKAEIAPYVGKFITAIEVGVDEEFVNLINYVLPWVAMGNFSDPSGFPLEEGELFDWFDESYTPMKAGWNVIPINPPLEITDNNLFIGYEADAAQGFGWGVSYNDFNPANVENGNWFVNGGWVNVWAEHPDNAGNLAVIATIMDQSCPAVTNFQVECKGNGEVELTWNAVPDVTAYSIRKDGAIVQENVTGTSFTFTFDEEDDYNLPHTWSVFYDCEGTPSSAASVTKQCGDGVIDIEKTEFRILPNPAKDQIRISAAKNFNKIEVVNFLGQTVFSSNETGTQTTVDVSNLVAGVYFVRMTTENGVNVKKFIKQ